MCVVYACWKETPSDSEMEDGAAANTDGAGICWSDMSSKAGGVRWIKGLSSDTKEIREVLKKEKIGYPFAIHFRTASIGGKCKELTHPFPVDDLMEDSNLEPGGLELKGSARRVLMHNGHIQSFKDWLLPILLATPGDCPSGPWSDSRALAVAAGYKGEAILEFIISGSRVMVMDSMPSVGASQKDPRSYIRLHGSGWISHEGWAQSQTTPSRSKHTSWEPAEPLHILPKRETKENAWTVEELQDLVTALRAEQNDAKILIGGA